MCAPGSKRSGIVTGMIFNVVAIILMTYDTYYTMLEAMLQPMPWGPYKYSSEVIDDIHVLNGYTNLLAEHDLRNNTNVFLAATLGLDTSQTTMGNIIDTQLFFYGDGSPAHGLALVPTSWGEVLQPDVLAQAPFVQVETHELHYSTTTAKSNFRNKTDQSCETMNLK